MNDKELLELAAKAAGLHVVWIDDSYYGPTLVIVEHSFAYSDGELAGPWKPLTYDGDALWLAVKLGLKIYIEHGYTRVKKPAPFHTVREEHGNDPFKATRRAIVRVAAEMGKHEGPI